MSSKAQQLCARTQPGDNWVGESTENPVLDDPARRLHGVLAELSKGSGEEVSKDDHGTAEGSCVGSGMRGICKYEACS